MKLHQFLSEYLGLKGVFNLSDQVNYPISKYFVTISEFDGILDGKQYHFQCRYCGDKTILDLNLVDYIPFSEKGIESLPYQNYCIVYLCDFEREGEEKLQTTVNDTALIISPASKEVRQIYLLRNVWGKHWSADKRLRKEFSDPEYDEAEPESRFIMGHRTKGRFKKNTPEMPLISIIMPTFNSEKTIEQSIQSVVYQDYPNYELLVIDGLSKDRTLEIAKKYEKYIDGVISEKDVNIFDAINKGTHLSRGEYSVFLGSDDLLLPFSLKTVAEIIIESGFYDYLYGNGLTLKVNKTVHFNDCFVKTKYFKDFYIMHPSLYIKKSTFEDLGGFNTSYHISSDADFELKLITNRKNGIHIEKPLTIFRDGGYSSLAARKMKQIWMIYRSYSAVNTKLVWHTLKYQIMMLLKGIFGRRFYFLIRSYK